MKFRSRSDRPPPTTKQPGAGNRSSAAVSVGQVSDLPYPGVSAPQDPFSPKPPPPPTRLNHPPAWRPTLSAILDAGEGRGEVAPRAAPPRDSPCVSSTRMLPIKPSGLRPPGPPPESNLMEVILELPEQVAASLGYPRETLPRRALEAFLVDECARGHLSRGKVAELLNLSFTQAEALFTSFRLPYPIKSSAEDAADNAQ